MGSVKCCETLVNIYFIIIASTKSLRNDFKMICMVLYYFKGKQFEYSSPSRSSLSVRNKEYLCINGVNDTSIWAVWSDVELKAKAKKGQYVKFINGNR